RIPPILTSNAHLRSIYCYAAHALSRHSRVSQDSFASLSLPPYLSLLTSPSFSLPLSFSPSPLSLSPFSLNDSSACDDGYIPRRLLVIPQPLCLSLHLRSPSSSRSLASLSLL